MHILRTTYLPLSEIKRGGSDTALVPKKSDSGGFRWIPAGFGWGGFGWVWVGSGGFGRVRPGSGGSMFKYVRLI